MVECVPVVAAESGRDCERVVGLDEEGIGNVAGFVLIYSGK